MKNYILFAFIWIAAACKKSNYDMPASSVSLWQVVKEDSYNFSTFRNLIERAGLTELYDDAGEYTVLAPNNSAFTAAGYTANVIAFSSLDSLQRLVKNHIVQGKVDLRAVNGSQELTALSGEKILVQKMGDAVYVDGGDLTSPQTLRATNGSLHIINKLLVSRSSILERAQTYVHATANNNISWCVAAIERASQGSNNLAAMLSDPKSDYTFFALMNSAFIEITALNTIDKIRAFDPDSLYRLLQYQLIQGRKLNSDLDSMPVNAVNGIPIYFDRRKPGTTTQNFANGVAFSSSSNLFGGRGVVHVVARPFPRPIATTTLARIKADTSLTFLDAAITKAGNEFMTMLGDAKASYTLYAVNNNGWRAAGYASAAAVTNETPEVLARILKFHMLRGRQNSINFANNSTTETLLVTGLDTRNYLTIERATAYKVKGNANTISATISVADLPTTNGLLNVINMVLLP